MPRSVLLCRTQIMPLLAALLIATPLALAQTKTIRSTEPWKGVVVPETLPVYSGRADVFDRIGGLERGQIITVREVNSFGWCSIAPPPGFFAFVAERDVELSADGIHGQTIGRTSLKYPVNDDPLQSWRICKVEENTDIVILETRETARGVFFKVAMPEAVDVYVDGQFVRRATEAELLAWEERLRQLAANEAEDGDELAAADEAEDGLTGTEPVSDTAATPEIPPVETTPLDEERLDNAVNGGAIPPDDNAGVEESGVEETSPAEAEEDMISEVMDDGLAGVVDQPTLQEGVDATVTDNEAAVSIAHVEEEGEMIESDASPVLAGSLDFETLEDLYADVKKAPILDAEIEPLLGAYRHLSEDRSADENTQRRARARVVILEIRLDHQQAKRRLATALEAATRHGQAEESALVARTGRVEVTGILKGSSVYDGVRLPALYRVIDEITGHTDCYVRPVEGLILSDFTGQRVTIIGKIGSGPGRSIEIITPTTIELLDLSAPSGDG